MTQHIVEFGLLPNDPGRLCRRCRQSIDPNDEFGRSEGICAPCRVEDRPSFGTRAPMTESALKRLLRRLAA